MRNRGASGGGTARKKSPQQGQRPSGEMGPAVSARSQWPRISQSGLMHCTVKPGKYCICAPSVGASSAAARAECAAGTPQGGPGEMMAGIVALKEIGVKRKGLLDIVVWLR